MKGSFLKKTQTSEIKKALKNDLAKKSGKVVSINLGAPITIAPVTGYVDGHAYVDLDLPSGKKWATMNIGAKKATEYGDFYAFGETNARDIYHPDEFTPVGNKSKLDLQKAGILNENTLTAKYDAATVNWGEKWKMPTKEDMEELLSNCTWEWTILNKCFGYKVISKKNTKNWIFLPAAGGHCVDIYQHAGIWGFYWSSSVRDYNDYLIDCTCGLMFNSSSKNMELYPYYLGHSVRPITE